MSPHLCNHSYAFIDVENKDSQLQGFFLNSLITVELTQGVEEMAYPSECTVLRKMSQMLRKKWGRSFFSEAWDLRVRQKNVDW